MPAPDSHSLIFKTLHLSSVTKYQYLSSLAVCLQAVVSINEGQSVFFCYTNIYYTGLRREVPIWDVDELRKARKDILQRLSNTELTALVAAWSKTTKKTRRDGRLVFYIQYYL